VHLFPPVSPKPGQPGSAFYTSLLAAEQAAISS
jgi:hypothetical protein